MLQPCRCVHNVRKAGGVRLWKAVLRETLDLAENALGEGLLIAAADHAIDDFLTEVVDDLLFGFPRGYGAAELVGLAR